MSTLGIDFGTTNSSASYIKSDGKPEAIRFIGHDLKIPSIVSFYGDTPMFGYEAQYMLDNSYGMRHEDQARLLSKTVKSIKRILDPNIRFCGYSHKKVVALFLKHIREQAQKACSPQRFDKLVLTHPVVFEEWKKQLLKDAALEAGFSSVELLYEPVSAAIGYIGSEELQNIRGLLVYDFGGGTFDVAYVMKQEGRFVVPFLPKGDSQCGGDDIDDAIYKFLIRKASLIIGSEYETKRDLGLLFQCRRWKEMLSSMDNLPISILSKRYPGVRFSCSLSRNDVESIAEGIVNKTVSLTKEVHDEAMVNRLPIDFVLLIGGSSNIPMIKKKLQEQIPNLEIRTTGTADIAVALGASYYAVKPVVVDPENEWCYCMYDGKRILKSYNFCIYCGKSNFFKTGKY
ncbi:MAG: Hsp70 family protein [Bacteroidaceae bacterium]|nr:Hsp70 family protein [Bacteroidaceae bacterium]